MVGKVSRSWGARGEEGGGPRMYKKGGKVPLEGVAKLIPVGEEKQGAGTEGGGLPTGLNREGKEVAGREAEKGVEVQRMTTPL